MYYQPQHSPEAIPLVQHLGLAAESTSSCETAPLSVSSLLALGDAPTNRILYTSEIEIMDGSGYVESVVCHHWPRQLRATSCPIKIPHLHLRLREVTQGLAQNATSRSGGQDLNPGWQRYFQSIALSSL